MWGGTVGRTEGPVTNCYNTGDYRSAIDGDAGNKASVYGGIAGMNSATDGVSITNCYNAGTFVMGGNTTWGDAVGLICGDTLKQGSLVNCYYLDTAALPSGNNTSDLRGGFLSAASARTATQLQAALFLAELNGGGSAFAADAGNINSGFPVLAWQGAPAVLSGDVNGDGVVNIQDTVQTVIFILGQTAPTAEQFNAADINKDGSINVQDVVELVNIVLAD